MMASIREYLLSVTAAGILCSVLTRLAGKKSATQSILRLLTGLFMTATVLSPLITLELDRFTVFTYGLSQQASKAAGEGTLMAALEMEAIIISRTETYILDKAADLGLTLEVRVELQDQVPSSVILQGAASPAAKARLTEWIADHLGIPTEAQEWI